jgi:3-phytase
MYKINSGNHFSTIFFFSLFVLFSSCKTLTNTEAIDDLNAFKKAQQEQLKIMHQVTANAETTPVLADSPDSDAADDPCVWQNISFPDKSLVFGSNKQFGIHSYGLDGNEKQFVSYAKINNIDIRQGLKTEKGLVDVLAASNRTSKSVDLFIIDSNGKIANQPDYQISLGAVNPYGLCLYLDNKERLFVFVNDKDGNVFQIEVLVKSNVIESRIVRKLKLSSQVEGMVADDVNDKLYVGEEMAGIFVFDAQPEADTRYEMLKDSGRSNPYIRFDIEGLALLPAHYLIASSQGNFSYALFDLKNNQYVTSFKISDDLADGVEETDGLDVFSGSLGANYPNGIFVVQDGFNFDETTKKTQNYKIIDLKKILELVKE